MNERIFFICLQHKFNRKWITKTLFFFVLSFHQICLSFNCTSILFSFAIFFVIFFHIILAVFFIFIQLPTFFFMYTYCSTFFNCRCSVQLYIHCFFCPTEYIVLKIEYDFRNIFGIQYLIVLLIKFCMVNSYSYFAIIDQLYIFVSSNDR